MNVMEINKIVGSACGALLIFLLIKWGAEITYHGSHDKIQAAYFLEIEEAETIAETLTESIPFIELVASANIDKGQKVFGKCKACHKLESGVNGTGPHLYAIVGRPIGIVENYTYSNVLANLGGNWTVDELGAFLTKPSKYAPGTKMSYSGLTKENDRANLIAYLKTIGN